VPPPTGGGTQLVTNKLSNTIVVANKIVFVVFIVFHFCLIKIDTIKVDYII